MQKRKCSILVVSRGIRKAKGLSAFALPQARLWGIRQESDEEEQGEIPIAASERPAAPTGWGSACSGDCRSIACVALVRLSTLA